MKVYLEGIGCERRLLELSKLKKYFEVNGYELTNRAGTADHLILVTCAFKNDEEKKSIARMKALSKMKGRLLVYGCLPGIAPSKLIDDGRIRYLSTRDLGEIDGMFENITVNYADVPAPHTISPKPMGAAIKSGARYVMNEMEFSGKSFLRTVKKVETSLKDMHPKTCDLFVCRGCLGDCSYCAIRYAIGPCRSKSVDLVLSEFSSGAGEGFNRFKLLGDDVGAFGLDNHTSFGELLGQIAVKSNQIRNGNNFSFCIDELHPRWAIRYQKQIMDFQNTGLLKELMCPVQSGNDQILKLMRRHHTATEIGDVLKKFAANNPDVNITTQVIVGFPFETESEFMDTLHFLEDSPISSVTIFPYSDKEIADSYQLAEKVPADEIDSRVGKAMSYLKKKDIKVNLSCPASW